MLKLIVTYLAKKYKILPEKEESKIHQVTTEHEYNSLFHQLKTEYHRTVEESKYFTIPLEQLPIIRGYIEKHTKELSVNLYPVFSLNNNNTVTLIRRNIKAKSK